MTDTVLRNLLSNALKYTKRGGKYQFPHRTGKLVEIAVKDNGVGMTGSMQRNFLSWEKKWDQRN
jgi:signal transduction histidine kinase